MMDTILNQRYRLDEELGRGSMGVVYRTHDLLLDRDVLVKVLSQARFDEAGRERLLREARATDDFQSNPPELFRSSQVECDILAGAKITPTGEASEHLKLTDMCIPKK
jgi:serine/threonine protein kinase